MHADPIPPAQETPEAIARRIARQTAYVNGPATAAEQARVRDTIAAAITSEPPAAAEAEHKSVWTGADIKRQVDKAAATVAGWTEWKRPQAVEPDLVAGLEPVRSAIVAAHNEFQRQSKFMAGRQDDIDQQKAALAALDALIARSQPEGGK